MLELIIVLTVLGILAAITIPGFFAYLPSYRLNSAARDLYSNLHLAKMAAIKANGTCTVTYNTGQNTYVITGALNKTVNFDDYGSGVGYQAPPAHASVAAITFNSRGQGTTFGYTYLSNTKKSAYYRVGALLSGIVKLNRWGGGTTWN